MSDHISKEQFLLEFFGLLGRELADPNQQFTDNPNDILTFIEKCAKEKKPAFISVQPRTSHNQVFGIEKIFFDFDYEKKSERLSDNEVLKRKEALEKEIRIFLFHIEKLKIIPLIIKTRRGYHIHIYFDRIYQITKDLDFWSKVYRKLQERFIENNRHEYKYIDSAVIGNIRGLCRIPTSIHQKSGEECKILNNKLKPDKFRSVEYYKFHGLKAEDLRLAIHLAKNEIERTKVIMKEHHKEKARKWELSHGFIGEVRPCFKRCMEIGEMSHKMRLAFLREIYYSGHQTEGEMLEFFKSFNDYNEKISAYQIRWFLENMSYKSKPWKCSTLEKSGFCIKDDCIIYRRRKDAETKRKEKA